MSKGGRFQGGGEQVGPAPGICGFTPLLLLHLVGEFFHGPAALPFCSQFTPSVTDILHLGASLHIGLSLCQFTDPSQSMELL